MPMTKIQVLATGNDEKMPSDYIKNISLMYFVDIQMKRVSGLEASRQILAQYPEAKILLLTTFSDDEYIVKALQIGAKGYLLKQDYESIIPAIDAVYSGQTVFGTETTKKIPDLSFLPLITLWWALMNEN